MFLFLFFLEEHEELLQKEKEAHVKAVEQAKLFASMESGFVLFKNIFYLIKLKDLFALGFCARLNF